MPYFKKKPVVVQAHQLPEDESLYPYAARNILNWILEESSYSANAYIDSATDQIKIFTLEGLMTAKPGWWIIKGIEGEFYSCDPEVFKKSYEEVEGSWS